MTTLTLRRRRATHGTLIASAARIGLLARGLVYLLIGWLAAQIARGHTRQQANQKGAIATIAEHRGGLTALYVLGFGLAAYALWRLVEAAVGTAAHGRKAGPRVQSLARGLIYAGFAIVAFRFATGSPGGGQAQEQESVTARLVTHTPGRVLVAAAGLIVVVVGVAMVVSGVRRSFERELRMTAMTHATRTVVVRLGMIGNIARGTVFALAGALVVDAALTRRPSKSTGLDGALRTLANRPYGPVLLGIAAAGLIAFGLYGLAAARWGRVRPDRTGAGWA